MTELMRTQPQALDIEELVLGALLIDGRVMVEYNGKLYRDLFYKDANRLIYNAIERLYREEKAVDPATVCVQLKEDGYLEASGGPFYISQLTNRVTSSANVETHIKILQEKFIAREIIVYCAKLEADAFNEANDVLDLVDTFNLGCEAVNNVIINNQKPIDKFDLLRLSVKELEEREQLYREGRPQGITTGIRELNKLTGGWQNGDLVIIAARPSVGKTSVAIHFANEACKQGKYVKVFSLEMSKIKIMDKFIMMNGGIDAGVYRRGGLVDEEWGMVNSAVSLIGGFNLEIDDKSAVSPNYIKTACRIAKKKNELDMVVIDYLQLMTPSTTTKGQNRERDISSITAECKQIAKECNVPVLLLSQLNRDVEKRGSRKPILADLRESGAIEQDADLVVFIYRPAYHGITEDESGNSTEGIGELIAAKHRNGSVGSVFFSHNPEMTQISDFKYKDYGNTDQKF